MRASLWFSATLRETPHDAELISHQLMLRAGMIRKLSSGLYTWLPLGLKVLRKIEQIIRQEMNSTGALEILMPAVQPAELWQETERWETFGGQLLTMQDSNGRDYCFGPTHEEVITDLARNELRSYKQLPVNFYQIQTKFRDEIRPRFGVMRAREFLMKDAYSFHLTQSSLDHTYEAMYRAYCHILDRLGLQYRAVEADTGAIGGSKSHEFQVLAQSGEDLIFYSDKSDYAANVEQASAWSPPPAQVDMHLPEKELIDTPNKKSISEVASFLKIPEHDVIKTLCVVGKNHPIVALVLRGNDELNEVKACKHPLVQTPLKLVDEATIEKILKVPVGFIGPVDLPIPVIVDHYALQLSSFVCGANQADNHWRNVAWQRDATYTDAADLRCVKEGDKAKDGQGTLRACRGIEVGHVFQLGDKYAQAMKAQVLNESGELQTLIMGCYGFGVSRVVAAAIEQHHDARGIVWPKAIAPFDVVIIPINAHRSERVKNAAEKLYQDLLQAGFDVLLDDREERPGVLFADNDLIGIPKRIVISEKLLDNQQVEYKQRHLDAVELITFDAILSIL